MPIIIDPNVFGADLNIDDYSSNAMKWAISNVVVLQTIYCPCIDADVKFSNNGFRHTIKQKKYVNKGNYNHETISLVSCFQDLIANSTLRYKSPDKHNGANTKWIIKLKSKFSYNGVVKEVEFLIKEVYINKELDITELNFYDHVII